MKFTVNYLFCNNKKTPVENVNLKTTFRLSEIRRQQEQREELTPRRRWSPRWAWDSRRTTWRRRAVARATPAFGNRWRSACLNSPWATSWGRRAARGCCSAGGGSRTRCRRRLPAAARSAWARWAATPCGRSEARAGGAHWPRRRRSPSARRQDTRWKSRRWPSPLLRFSQRPLAIRSCADCGWHPS